MASNGKSRKVAAEEQEDRLSSLPKHILSRILSLMPTEDSVRTSVLSNRWRHLYLEVPSIIIPVGDPTSGNPDFSSAVNFINRRILHSAPIREFQIPCRAKKEDQVDLCLLTLLLTRVQGETVLPRIPLDSCSPSKTLVVLKLCGAVSTLTIPESFSFPNLKEFHLKELTIGLESDDFWLADGFPVLEDLWMECISYAEDGRRGAIFGKFPTALRNLALTNAFPDDLVKLDIDAPNLQSLKVCTMYEDYEPVLSFCKSEYLVYAALSNLPMKWNIELFSNIQNVKKLNLEWFGQEYDGLYPHFPNLTHLELIGMENLSMWRLLQLAPNVEVLRLEVEDSEPGEIPADFNLCNAGRLREIRVSSFESEYDYKSLLQPLLLHGPVLEKVVIEHDEHPTNDDEWNRSVLSMFEELEHYSPEKQRASKILEGETELTFC